MEILFKNITTLSEQNYLTLIEFHQKRYHTQFLVYTFLFAFLLILCISFQIAHANYTIATIIFICFVAFLAYRIMAPYYKNKKEFKSDKIQKSLTNTYVFYQKFFEVSNKVENKTFRYYQLYKAYETEDFFYLYLNKNTAFIIEKQLFKIGTAKDFNKFLKNRCKWKYKQF